MLMFVAAVPCRLVGIVPVEGGFVNVGVCVDRLAVGVEPEMSSFPWAKETSFRTIFPPSMTTSLIHCSTFVLWSLTRMS